MRFCSEDGSPGQQISNCNGGQSAQGARQIANYLNKIPHKTYVEPFLGVGNVYRAKNQSQQEILNDLDCKRIKAAETRSCYTISQKQCDRLKAAKVSCGKDYKDVLKQYDSEDTLFYLDPPYHDKVSSQVYASTGLDFSRFVDSAKELKGKVAISYSDNADFKKQFCSKDSEFRCHKIQKHILSNHYNEILAVKK